MRTEYAKNALLKVAQEWPLEHLNGYIENLEEQISDIRGLIQELKSIQKSKQRERNRKLRDSGTRGAV